MPTQPTSTVLDNDLVRVQMRAETAVNMAGGGVIRFKREGVYDIPRDYAEKWCHPRQKLAVVYGEPLRLDNDDQGFESGIVLAAEVNAHEVTASSTPVNALERAATREEMAGEKVPGFKASAETTSYVPDREEISEPARMELNNTLRAQIEEVRAKKGQ